MCFSPQRRTIFRQLNFKKCSEHLMFCTFSRPNVLFTTAACNFSTSELQKVLRAPHVLCIFTSKSAFRDSGVHFFDIRTSKSAPNMWCFVTFSFPNVLFATAACIFSTSELQKVLRHRQFFNILTSKCAFRYSGVHFLISPLSTYLRTRRFNRPTFRLTRHTNHWKNTAFRDFSNIWRGCIFFLLTFALLHLLSADLTTLLCFSTVHIVGSFYLNFLRSNIHDVSGYPLSKSLLKSPGPQPSTKKRFSCSSKWRLRLVKNSHRPIEKLQRQFRCPFKRLPIRKKNMVNKNHGNPRFLHFLGVISPTFWGWKSPSFFHGFFWGPRECCTTKMECTTSLPTISARVKTYDVSKEKYNTP